MGMLCYFLPVELSVDIFNLTSAKTRSDVVDIRFLPRRFFMTLFDATDSVEYIEVL